VKRKQRKPGFQNIEVQAFVVMGGNWKLPKDTFSNAIVSNNPLRREWRFGNE
jgi:hypothetical protein